MKMEATFPVLEYNWVFFYAGKHLTFTKRLHRTVVRVLTNANNNAMRNEGSTIIIKKETSRAVYYTILKLIESDTWKESKTSIFSSWPTIISMAKA